jgi:hypothetical protein
MKSLVVLLALGLLGAAVTACGGSSSTNNAGSATRVASSSSPAAPPSYTNRPAVASHKVEFRPPRVPTRHDLEVYDRDEDDYIHVPDDNNPSPPGYVDASPEDRQAVTAVVKRYYAAALKGDGASGCAMIDPGLVRAIPLDYGKLGAAYLQRAAHTCPAVMSLMFKHEHRKLAGEVPQLHVMRVSVLGTAGVAILRFGKLHERFISVLREGSTWRIGSVLDGELE